MTTADIGENDLLALAAAVEQGSSHPLARAVVREAEQRQLVIPPASGQRALAGSGIEAQVEGRQVLICAAGKTAIHSTMNLFSSWRARGKPWCW